MTEQAKAVRMKDWITVEDEYGESFDLTPAAIAAIRRLLLEDATRVEVEWTGPLGHGEIWADDAARHALVDLETP